MSRSFYIAAAISLILTGSASAAFPQLTGIYTASGATNSGAARTGTATLVHCTNFTNATQTVRYTVRSSTGAVAGTFTAQIFGQRTQTMATKDTVAFVEHVLLNTGTVVQGSILVEATAAAVFCSAMIVDAAAPAAHGVALHMVRHNALAGTQE